MNYRIHAPYSFVGIGEASWAFKTSLLIDETDLSAPNVDLVFDGLDTFAKVYLVRIVVNLPQSL